MTGESSVLAALIIAFNCCSNQTTQEKKVALKNQKVDSAEYIRLYGIWIRHNKTGIILKEIKDTSNVLDYHSLIEKLNWANQPMTDIGTTNPKQQWVIAIVPKIPIKRTLIFGSQPANFFMTTN